jgi:hypothetical protein
MAPGVSGGNTQVLFTELLVDKRHKAAYILVYNVNKL